MFVCSINNPAINIDPKGLFYSPCVIYGANCTESPDPTPPDYSPCEYYERMCQERGCIYHCFAIQVCRGKNRLINRIMRSCRANNRDLNCIRRCLVRKDKAIHKGDDIYCRRENSAERASGRPVHCGGSCNKRRCINNYHNECFLECGIPRICYGGNWDRRGNVPDWTWKNDGD